MEAVGAAGQWQLHQQGASRASHKSRSRAHKASASEGSSSVSSQQLLGALRDELQETEQLIAHTRRRQCDAEAALEGVLGERHALHRQLLLQAATAVDSAGGNSSAAASPCGTPRAGEGVVRISLQSSAGGGDVGCPVAVPAEQLQYGELLARYQEECQLRVAAQERVMELESEYGAAVDDIVEERQQMETVLHSLQGIQSRYAHLLGGSMAVHGEAALCAQEDSAAEPSGPIEVAGGQLLGNGHTAEELWESGSSPVGSERESELEELRAAYAALQRHSEAVEARAEQAELERDALRDRLGEMEVALAALRQQLADAQQAQAGGEYSSHSSASTGGPVSPATTITGVHAATPTLTSHRLVGSASLAASQQWWQRGEQGEAGTEPPASFQLSVASQASAHLQLSPAPAAPSPSPSSLSPSLSSFESVALRLEQLAAKAAGEQRRQKEGRQERDLGGNAAALQREVELLKSCLCVAQEKLAAEQAAVEELEGALSLERSSRAVLEGRVAAMQREARLAERQRLDMQQHIGELQALVEAAIEEAESSRALMQKVAAAAEGGGSGGGGKGSRGQRLQLGELWTKLMEAETRAASAMRPAAKVAAGADAAGGQLYEVVRMLEEGSKRGEGSEGHASGASRASRSSSLRSRLNALNDRFSRSTPDRPPGSPRTGNADSDARGGGWGSGGYSSGISTASAPSAPPRPALPPPPSSSQRRWAPLPHQRLSPRGSAAPAPLALPLADQSSVAAVPATPPSSGSANGSDTPSSVAQQVAARHFADKVMLLHRAVGSEVMSGAEASAGVQQGNAYEGFSLHVQELLLRALESPVAQQPALLRALPPLPATPPSASSVAAGPAAEGAVAAAGSADAAVSSGSVARADVRTTAAVAGAGEGGAAVHGHQESSEDWTPAAPALRDRQLLELGSCSNGSPHQLSFLSALSAIAAASPAAAAAPAGGAASSQGSPSSVALPSRRLSAPWEELPLPYFRRAEGLAPAEQQEAGVPRTGRRRLGRLVPAPLRLLCANTVLWLLSPVNVTLFNRLTAGMSAGGSGLVGLTVWLALAQQQQLMEWQAGRKAVQAEPNSARGPS